MKWLSSALHDNRIVAGTFLSLAVVNAFAMSRGWY